MRRKGRRRQEKAEEGRRRKEKEKEGRLDMSKY